MSSTTSARAHWSSRWAFILVTAGSAIGLGNIWKFPYMTGTNGGSAFVLVYLACIVGIGLPLLMAEIMLGRRGQENPADTLRLSGAPVLPDGLELEQIEVIVRVRPREDGQPAPRN